MKQRKTKNNRNPRQFKSNDDSLTSSENTGAGLFHVPIAVVYPKDVYVYRTAKNLTRVAQPQNMAKLMQQSNYKFAIVDDPTNAFGITQLAGILYVRNVTALKIAPETIY